MRISLILISLSVAILAGTYVYFSDAERAREERYFRDLGAQRVVEAEIMASSKAIEQINLYPASALRALPQADQWYAAGQADIIETDGRLQRKSFEAVLRNTCSWYTDTRCWEMRALALADSMIVGTTADLNISASDSTAPELAAADTLAGAASRRIADSSHPAETSAGAKPEQFSPEAAAPKGPLTASVDEASRAAPSLDELPHLFDQQAESVSRAAVRSEFVETEPVEPEIAATEPVEPEIAATEPVEPEIAATEPVEPEIAATEPVEAAIIGTLAARTAADPLPASGAPEESGALAGIPEGEAEQMPAEPVADRPQPRNPASEPLMTETRQADSLVTGPADEAANAEDGPLQKTSSAPSVRPPLPSTKVPSGSLGSAANDVVVATDKLTSTLATNNAASDTLLQSKIADTGQSAEPVTLTPRDRESGGNVPVTLSEPARGSADPQSEEREGPSPAVGPAIVVRQAAKNAEREPVAREAVSSARPAPKPEVLTELTALPPHEINKLGDGGLTPLIRAIVDSEPAKVRALLAHGADPNFESGSRATPLMYAAWQGDVRSVALLADAGGDLNRVNLDGKTALMAAAAAGNAAIVKQLLMRGANADIQALRGWTALMYAVWRNHPDVIDVLLEHGANPRVRNRQGKTALDLAAERNNDAAQKRLENCCG